MDQRDQRSQRDYGFTHGDKRLAMVLCIRCKNTVYHFELYDCKGMGGWCHHGRWPIGIPRPYNIPISYVCGYGCSKIGPPCDNY